MNSISVSNRITIGANECAHNVFIKALKTGGILNLFTEKGPFEALLVPQQSSLLSCGLDAFLRMTPPAAEAGTASLPFQSPAETVQTLVPNSLSGTPFTLDAASPPAISHSNGENTPAMNVSKFPRGGVVRGSLQTDENSLLEEIWKVLREFLLFHIIHFDSDGNSRFTTAKGQRGEFSDALDAVKRFGRLGEVPVLSDMNPLLTRADSSLAPHHPLRLHMYIIDRPLMDKQELGDLLQRLQRVVNATRGKAPTVVLPPLPFSPNSSSAGEGPRGGTATNPNAQTDNNLSEDDVVVEVDLTPCVSENSRQQTHSVQNRNANLITHEYSKESIMDYKAIVMEDNEIFYPEFEHLMSKPICSELVKLITGFILEVQRKPPPAKIDRIYDRFMHITCEAVEKICSSGDDTTRFTILHEGLEKFVLSRLYLRVFNTNPVDLHKNENLQEKLKHASALSAVELDALQEVEQHYMWGQAMFELDGMNFFKSPRDKLRCAMRASKLLTLVIGNVLLERKSDSTTTKPSLEGKEPKGDVEAAPGGIPAIGADVFLPCFMLLVLRAQPYNYWLNVNFIEKYRGKFLCSSEESYVLSNLNASVEFWMGYGEEEAGEGGESALRRLAARCPTPGVLDGDGLLPSLRQASALLRPAKAAAFKENGGRTASEPAAPPLDPSPRHPTTTDAFPSPTETPPPPRRSAEQPSWLPFRLFFGPERPAGGEIGPPTALAGASQPAASDREAAQTGAIRDLLVVQNKAFDELTLLELRMIVEEARVIARRPG